MNWGIFLSSLIIGFITLLPLGIKWGIEKKVLIAGVLFIGILSGAIVNTTIGLLTIEFYKIILLEFFIIGTISITLLLFRFYRDPERIFPDYENAIVSPADGRVIYVKKIEKGAIPFSEKNGNKFFLKDFIQSDVFPHEGHLIGISMNFLDVHVNRAPIEGTISLLRHIKGTFISLKRREAVLQNERALTVIDNGYFKIGIVQIASRLVRKIIPYVREGYEVRRGQRIGMIRFGSQVDLYLPDLPSLYIKVNPEEKVKAGISVIATLK